MIQELDPFTSLPFEMFSEIVVGNFSLAERAKLATVNSVFRNYVYKINNQVKNLNLRGWNQSFTDVSFRKLPSLFPNVKSLNMHSCHKISIEAFLETIPQLTHLEKLDLSWVPLIVYTDGFSKIAPILSKLKCLHLDYNEEIPRAHFLAGIKHLGNLEYLSIDSCLQFDDDTLLAMIEYLPKLAELNLNRVEFLTDNALMTIARMKPQLTIQLNKNGYPQIEKIKFSSMPQIKFI